MLDIRIPALSIREPYATLIMEGKKDIELRSWKPPAWVNEFYIHVPVIVDKGLCKEHNIIPHPPKTIIGKARISEIKHYDTTDEFMKDYQRHYCKYLKYNYGFILYKVEKVGPEYGILGQCYFFFLRKSF
jgi:predicted transcriptional regulator